ncbi:alpha/beta fold hydrolase [Burkholderia territorii]|uniref:alpha/beta fold hydrolase n=1 Tax=Burkholderia territorii TaxID=1503055 RepID=UPI0009BEB632|nr:alpha/beta hydrolase [Burkholderia territorii]
MTAGTRLAGTPDPMHFWTGADGIRIAGDAWGHPDAPLILFLHGGGQTRHAWRSTAERLGAEGYYAVTFDARGHGDSEWSADGDYSQDAMVRDLECIVAAVGAGQPILAGASMGGGTCLVAAGDEYVRARALILVDIVPSTEQVGFDRVSAFMEQNPDGFESLDEVADTIAKFRPQRARPSNLRRLAKNVRRGEDGRFRWHWDPRLLNSRRKDLASRYERLSSCARRLTLPTLLVRGGSSDFVSEAGAHEFLAMCPHAEYVNVLGAGHMLGGDRNDAFGTAAMSFLARTVVAESASDDRHP